MRVIAGAAKGRLLKAVPGKNTRPTTDKVKEAIFSMIGPFFDGGIALDLFAGTGGLGIEAWSRGAERAIFIDQEKNSIDIIRHNTQAAGMGQEAEIYRNDAERALKLLEKRGIAFRLVFLDPPYRIITADKLMTYMADHDMLEDGAIIVVEHDAAHSYEEQWNGFFQTKKNKYGDTAVTIYRYEPNEAQNGGLIDADE
ncbi:16S rRNA (guanine(966)-N(2))-methyltransferase RsmD [Paenibacillus algorifonticola]|uniref:16S rRNA (Guanine(966)-N(2))-methyltransferase RsmD n=1 Tax=Paenibacillus algorifonticola TaxID=684063 RepID=A0A1I1YCM1_9BACL|nr:16S rRNA (guanine(966)-N(2))-methyltransferase RsmD [Paenibacillus algorifonticola]SFE15660.1 16S rRNA (guanine(966)-N(2))-methyltransferase RsmD [Paenibacillus algorifonticola]